MPSRTTAVIVTYNSREQIGPALAALRESHDDGELDCIVVDNHSADDTVEVVRQDHPWVALIACGENLGYGRGLNLGVSHATTPYVLLMNPDAIARRAAVRELARFLDAEARAGVVAPAIQERDGSFQCAGILPTPWRIVLTAAGFARWTRRQQTIVPGSAPFRTDWLCGAILMARRSVMSEVGGFDPRYFLYFEETDLCRRVAAKGHELWAVGTATAYHESGASARRTGERRSANCIAEHLFRSRYYYLTKFHGRPAAVLTEWAEMFFLGARWLLSKCGIRAKDRALAERLAGPIMALPARVSPENDSRKWPPERRGVQVGGGAEPTEQR